MLISKFDGTLGFVSWGAVGRVILGVNSALVDQLLDRVGDRSGGVATSGITIRFEQVGRRRCRAAGSSLPRSPAR